MATKKHSSKAETAGKLSQDEQALVDNFRRLESKHDKSAVLILMSSLAYGKLARSADKLPARRFVHG